MFLSRLRPHSLRSLSALLLITGTLSAQDADPAPLPTPAPTTPPPAGSDAPVAPPEGARPPGPPGEGGFGPGSGRFGGRRRPGEGGFGGTTGGPAGAGGPGGENIQSTLAQTIRMEGDRYVLQFPNNPVADMLSIYELLTNITLVKDTNIFNDGAPVSLATPRSVSKEEAVKLIEATLLTNGYAIVMEPDGKSARILPARNQSANAVQFSHGVRFYTSAKELPDGETIISYFMKLDYLDPEEAATMLSGHVGLSVYGRITPVLMPPGLLLTESSTVIKQLISIREAIDVGDTGSSLVTKFIPVEYAEAATIAQIIQATLTAQAQEKETKGVNTIRGNAASDGRNREERRDDNNNNSNNNRSQQPMIINGQVVQGGAKAPMPSAQVVADTRLNQILVVSSPEDYTYIASLIAEFDKPLQVDEPYERKLKYAAAVDVLSAITDLLQDTNTGGTVQLPGGGTIQQQRTQPLASSSSQLLTGRTTTGTRGGQVLATSGSTSDDTATATSAGSSRADLIQAPTEDNAPISVLVGKTRVVADPMANSILVMGRKEAIDKVNGLLDKLDRKPSQVYLSTVIGQLTLGDGFEFGIDYLSALNNKDGTNFSAGSVFTRDALTNAVGDLRNNAITNAFGPAQGLNLYGSVGDSLEIFVTALETTNRFKVLSRPSVFALNNKKASITSGQLIPVPSQTLTSTNGNNNNGNNVTTTIEYRDVVLKLEVVPLINEDGEVSLTIAQVNDTVIGTQRVEPNDIPIIGTEQIVTTVTVPDGNTIVLGGLISEQNKKDTNGVPFLSRIPGVGNLFKDNKDSNSRSELIIFIQPKVVTDNLSLRNTSLREDFRTQVGADAAERFPENVDVQAPRISEAKEVEQLESAAQQKQGFFSRMFRRSSTPKAVTPPPGVRR
ncbi:type II secretion system secretin GspD [Prosthecobacter algae]|uniref:Type II secretion system secretin GspD n=1 Tax=Prosthecobacter algae TaxID=1144682 RepID=A0ABP9PHV5_9BACT